MNVASGRWMAVVVGLTLMLGVSIGVVLDRSVLGVAASGARRARREEDRGRFMARLTTELALSAEQQAVLGQTLSARHAEAQAFWREARAEFSKLRQEYRDEIRDMLEPEQRARFEEMLAEAEARHRQREHR